MPKSQAPQTLAPEKTSTKVVKKIVKVPTKNAVKPKTASTTSEKKIVKVKTETNTVRQVTVKPSQKNEQVNTSKTPAKLVKKVVPKAKATNSSTKQSTTVPTKVIQKAVVKKEAQGIEMNPEDQESNKKFASYNYHKYKHTGSYLERAEERLLYAQEKLKYAREHYERSKNREEAANRTVEEYILVLESLRETDLSDCLHRCIKISKKVAADKKIITQMSLESVEHCLNLVAYMEDVVKTYKVDASTELSHGSN